MADLNEDGKLDVAFPVTGNKTPHHPSTTVLIFLGDGTGKLVCRNTSNSRERNLTPLLPPDLNKDGHIGSWLSQTGLRRPFPVTFG